MNEDEAGMEEGEEENEEGSRIFGFISSNAKKRWRFLCADYTFHASGSRVMNILNFPTNFTKNFLQDSSEGLHWVFAFQSEFASCSGVNNFWLEKFFSLEELLVKILEILWMQKQFWLFSSRENIRQGNFRKGTGIWNCSKL